MLFIFEFGLLPRLRFGVLWCCGGFVCLFVSGGVRCVTVWLLWVWCLRVGCVTVAALVAYRFRGWMFGRSSLFCCFVPGRFAFCAGWISVFGWLCSGLV